MDENEPVLQPSLPQGHTLLNREVTDASRNSDAFSTTYWQERHVADNRIVLRLNGFDAAVTHSRKLSDQFNAFLRSDFIKAHRIISGHGELNPDLKRLIAAYAGHPLRFHKSVRTVGCGSQLYICLDNGEILQTCVRRSDNGRISRAAGGAVGDIPAAQMREMTEEMFVFIKDEDGLTLLDIDRSDTPVDEAEMLDIFAKRAKELELHAGIIKDRTGVALSQLKTRRITAQFFTVPGLHQKIEQIIGNQHKIFPGIYADDAAHGDISGVDCTLYLRLSGITREQIIIIDGELKLDGTPLYRNWFLMDPLELRNKLHRQEEPFSPAMAFVVNHAEAMLSAIRKCL